MDHQRHLVGGLGPSGQLTLPWFQGFRASHSLGYQVIFSISLCKPLYKIHAMFVNKAPPASQNLTHPTELDKNKDKYSKRKRRKKKSRTGFRLKRKGCLPCRENGLVCVVGL